MRIIATHNGTFHADDVFASVMLRLSTNGPVQLLRSRNQSDWDRAEIVFDVGGIYDPEKGRYDHHMRDKPLRPDGKAYSSAGLIWRDYGLELIGHLLPDSPLSVRQRIHAMLDQGLVHDVDGMDNGEITPQAGHFSALLEDFNPTFAEQDRDEHAAFDQAAQMAETVLRRSIAHAHAAALAEHSIAEAAALSPDPRLIVLEQRLPWEPAVFALGLEQVLYVIRPSGTDWTCSAVPPTLGSFAQRQPLPEAWGGLRDADLVAVTGIPDATFCHPALFVCGAKSRQGAVALALLSLGEKV